MENQFALLGTKRTGDLPHQSPTGERFRDRAGRKMEVDHSEQDRVAGQEHLGQWFHLVD